LFLALLVVYLRRQKGPGWSTLESRFAWSYLALHAWIFGLLWRSYATWYAMPWFAILLVVLTATRPRRAEVWSRPARLAAAVSALLLASFLGVAYTVRVDHGARGPERRFRPLLEKARAVLPEGGNLGAFDAGAVGYVAGAYPGLRVVNLDCLVNNVAYAALRDGRYGDYVVRTVDLFLQRPRRARMFLDESDYEEMMREFREKVESREGSPSPN
jgi:hypothetical protein